MRGMVRQHPTGSTLASEEKSQIYTLLTSTSPQEEPAPAQPAYMEVGVLTLVPVVFWCLLSWALSYAGSSKLLAKFELFAFVPAAAAAFACARMQQLRCLPAQLTCLKEENEWFRSSNAELKQGVELLRAENDEARTTVQNLQNSIKGLESVRSAIETYASRHETDFGHVLSEFQKNVAEQQSILTRTRQIQRRTHRLAEAQWRALMLNLFSQVERYSEGKRGMTRKGYDMWLAMLPTEISDRLSPETFENIDANGDGVIEVKEMCAWVRQAVKTLLRAEQGESDGSEESEEDASSVAITHSSVFVNPFGGGGLPAPNAQGLINPFAPAARRGSADRQNANTSRASSSKVSEEEEDSIISGHGKSSPRVRGINLAGSGDLRLFATHPPVVTPGGGSPGGASSPGPGGSASSPGVGSPGSPASAPGGVGSGVCGDGREGRDGRRRDSSTPLRQGSARPSFNDGYMQKLFGSPSPPSVRRACTGSLTPPSGQRAASTA